jgi:hypothetical protein
MEEMRDVEGHYLNRKLYVKRIYSKNTEIIKV